MVETKLRLGEILVDAGVLKQEQLNAALAVQKKRGIRLGQVLLQEAYISEPQLVQALSRRLSIPWVSLDHVDIADELLDLVPSHVAEEFFLIPVYVQSLDRKNRTLFVAMNDPTDEVALRFVSASAGMPVKPMVAGPSDISAAIQTHYYGEDEADYDQPMIHSSTPPSDAAPQSLPPERKVSPAADETEPDDTEPDDTERISDADIIEAESDIPIDTDAGSPQPIEDMLAAATESEQDKRQRQREVEKHMFGVGTKRRGMSLTLLDGTKIDFGGSSRKVDPSDNMFSQSNLIAGLRAAAQGTPMEDYLPTDKWEDFMAALLHVLFKKNLVFFDEFIEELRKRN